LHLDATAQQYITEASVTDCSGYCDWQPWHSRTESPSLVTAAKASAGTLLNTSVNLKPPRKHTEDRLRMLLKDRVRSAENAAAAIRGASRTLPRAARSAKPVVHPSRRCPQDPRVARGILLATQLVSLLCRRHGSRCRPCCSHLAPIEPDNTEAGLDDGHRKRILSTPHPEKTYPRSAAVRTSRGSAGSGSILLRRRQM
jgi:hypothetical protein